LESGKTIEEDAMRSFLAFLFVPALLLAQSSSQDSLKERESKIEIILRTQDLRTPHDGKLISFLSDGDPAVRERAVRAYASIQDTSVLARIVRLLTDADPQVELSAAFSLAQTAAQLSKPSRQTLEHDVIWNRLDAMQPQAVERMIEEIGKFATDQGLDDLLLRFTETYPQVHTQSLAMCVARCAVRNVTTSRAVQYLLRFIRPPDAIPWQVMYALQRIGDREESRHEIDQIAQIYRHQDPIVRMHLATLLGKIRDERTSLEPLRKLAESDPDWRVRVNALKALSNFNIRGKDEIVETFRRAFYSENMYISLTALSAFGNTGLSLRDSSGAVKEAFSAIERMSENADHQYLWQIQGEAVISLAKLGKKNVLRFLHPENSSPPQLQADMLEAVGSAGTPAESRILLVFLDESDPILHRAALESLQNLSERNPRDSALVNQTYNAALAGLQSGDVAVVTTSAAILGDSLFRRSASVGPLLETLSHLRVPYDIEAMQEIASTLGELRDNRAVDALMEQLKQSDRSVALASASALEAITGRDYSRAMMEWYQPLVTDFDFGYLRSLPDTVRVLLQTIRGDVTLELYKNTAPFTVMSFLKLAGQRGFYRGLIFHRVVPNFVIQGGDPRGDGWGGPEYTLRSEFSLLTFDAGMLGMADAGKDTPGSQFFITQSPQPHLDGRYTIFGRVISGMDVANSMQVGDRIFDAKVTR
jgi:peptidylprolyl isomerase